MKSKFDVWFILDIQPFFALCDKNYLTIQKEGGEGLERGLHDIFEMTQTQCLVCFLSLSISTRLLKNYFSVYNFT